MINVHVNDPVEIICLQFISHLVERNYIARYKWICCLHWCHCTFIIFDIRIYLRSCRNVSYCVDVNVICKHGRKKNIRNENISFAFSWEKNENENKNDKASGQVKWRETKNIVCKYESITWLTLVEQFWLIIFSNIVETACTHNIQMCQHTQAKLAAHRL